MKEEAQQNYKKQSNDLSSIANLLHKMQPITVKNLEPPTPSRVRQCFEVSINRMGSTSTSRIQTLAHSTASGTSRFSNTPKGSPANRRLKQVVHKASTFSKAAEAYHNSQAMASELKITAPGLNSTVWSQKNNSRKATPQVITNFFQTSKPSIAAAALQQPTPGLSLAAKPVSQDPHFRVTPKRYTPMRSATKDISPNLGVMARRSRNQTAARRRQPTDFAVSATVHDASLLLKKNQVKKIDFQEYFKMNRTIINDPSSCSPSAGTLSPQGTSSLSAAKSSWLNIEESRPSRSTMRSSAAKGTSTNPSEQRDASRVNVIFHTTLPSKQGFSSLLNPTRTDNSSEEDSSERPVTRVQTKVLPPTPRGKDWRVHRPPPEHIATQEAELASLQSPTGHLTEKPFQIESSSLDSLLPASALITPASPNLPDKLLLRKRREPTQPTSKQPIGLSSDDPEPQMEEQESLLPPNLHPALALLQTRGGRRLNLAPPPLPPKKSGRDLSNLPSSDSSKSSKESVISSLSHRSGEKKPLKTSESAKPSESSKASKTEQTSSSVNSATSGSTPSSGGTTGSGTKQSSNSGSNNGPSLNQSESKENSGSASRSSEPASKTSSSKTESSPKTSKASKQASSLRSEESRNLEKPSLTEPAKAASSENSEDTLSNIHIKNPEPPASVAHLHTLHLQRGGVVKVRQLGSALVKNTPRFLQASALKPSEPESSVLVPQAEATSLADSTEDQRAVMTVQSPKPTKPKHWLKFNPKPLVSKNIRLTQKRSESEVPGMTQASSNYLSSCQLKLLIKRQASSSPSASPLTLKFNQRSAVSQIPKFKLTIKQQPGFVTCDKANSLQAKSPVAKNNSPASVPAFHRRVAPHRKDLANDLQHAMSDVKEDQRTANREAMNKALKGAGFAMLAGDESTSPSAPSSSAQPSGATTSVRRRKQEVQRQPLPAYLRDTWYYGDKLWKLPMSVAAISRVLDEVLDKRTAKKKAEEDQWKFENQRLDSLSDTSSDSSDGSKQPFMTMQSKISKMSSSVASSSSSSSSDSSSSGSMPTPQARPRAMPMTRAQIAASRLQKAGIQPMNPVLPGENSIIKPQMSPKISSSDSDEQSESESSSEGSESSEDSQTESSRESEESSTPDEETTLRTETFVNTSEEDSEEESRPSKESSTAHEQADIILPSSSVESLITQTLTSKSPTFLSKGAPSPSFQTPHLSATNGSPNFHHLTLMQTMENQLGIGGKKRSALNPIIEARKRSQASRVSGALGSTLASRASRAYRKVSFDKSVAASSKANLKRKSTASKFSKKSRTSKSLKRQSQREAQREAQFNRIREENHPDTYEEPQDVDIKAVIAQATEEVQDKIRKQQMERDRLKFEAERQAEEAEKKKEDRKEYKEEKKVMKRKINQKMVDIENFKQAVVQEKEDLVNEVEKTPPVLEEGPSKLHDHSESSAESGEDTRRRYERIKISEKDEYLRKTFTRVGEETTAFLTSVLQDTYVRNEKEKILKLMKAQLKKLLDEKIEFVTMKKLQKSVLATLPTRKVLRANSQVLPTRALQNALQNKMLANVRAKVIQQQTEKLQKKSEKNVENILGKALMNMQERFSPRKGIFGRAKGKKKKTRLVSLIRKHLMKKEKFNILFLTKVIGMQVSLEEMLEEGGNIGKKYLSLKTNLWQNEYLKSLKLELSYYRVEYEPEFKYGALAPLGKVDALYEDTLRGINFYKEAKDLIFKELDEEAPEEHRFIKNCELANEIPMPSFVKIRDNQMTLSGIKISPFMSETLRHFLTSSKDIPEKQVKRIFLNETGMKDADLAVLLTGLKAQGKHLKTLSISNDEIGTESAGVIESMGQQLQELQLANIPDLKQTTLATDTILNSLMDYNNQLQTLKLSRINLNNGVFVELLQSLITKLRFLSHLDLSWTRLQPKQMVKVTEALKDCLRVRWINLSYNTLDFEKGCKDFAASEDAFLNINDIITKTKILVHLDLSGMKLGKDQLLYLADGLAASQYLCSVHLSDNGLMVDSQAQLEILEKFGLNYEEVFGSAPTGDFFQTNKLVRDPVYLQKITSMYTGTLSSKRINLHDEHPFHTSYYKKHILQSAEGKAIHKNRVKNSITLHQGIGRTENNFDDKFILTRKANAPELIFNQNRLRDSYFEMQAQENWAFTDKQECYLCERHKEVLIFFDQRLGMGLNKGLIEIKDQNIIDDVRELLHLRYKELEEIAPIIVGSVVGENRGGFNRKLRMLRGDLFTMLSVCASKEFISSYKQSFAVQRGIFQMVLDNQKIKVQESLDFLKGWEMILQDKCLNSETADLSVFNLPKDFGKYEVDPESKETVYPECETFVYAAYLPAGLHQFLIYCPVQKRLFCKDIMVDLCHSDHFPEFPLRLELANKKQGIIRKDVWAKFKIDTEEDMAMAFQNDLKGSCQLEVFIKDPEDCERVKEIGQESFPFFQVAYLEGLVGSPLTYPEIGFDAFLKSIQDQQGSKERKKLTRSMIELSFISATRGDGVKGVGGTLCRGEFYAIILRLCKQIHPKSNVSDHLEDFLETYLLPVYEKSELNKVRKKIRLSKKLNMLLFDNAKGLTMLYNQYCNTKINRFTMDSAKFLLSKMSDTPDAPTEKTFLQVRKCFIFSKMTNLLDLTESKKYFYLLYVEFLEMLCRFSIKFWNDKAAFDDECKLETIEEKVYASLQRLWKYRQENPPPQREGLSKAQQKLNEFPELMPIPGDDD